MRVLFVSGCPRGTMSAYQHRLDSLAAALREHGVHSDMCYADREGWILRGGIGRQLRTFARPMPWGEYDFFHAGASLMAFSVAWRRPARGARVTMDCHGLRYAEVDQQGPTTTWRRLGMPLLEAEERYAARWSDCCVTVSQPLLEHLAAWRGHRRRLSLVRNGVDLTTFVPATDTGKRAGPFTVAYAGGFQAYQAVDLLVEASKLLRDENAIRWRIIGFTPADAAIKQMMEREMPPGTELIDRCDRATLRRLLQECDLMTIPRRPHLACRVALPTKFAEYLAMAKPVLVNTVDETEQIVRQEGCGFVAAPEPADMARVIREALAISPERLAEMGRVGRAYVERELSWSVIGRRYKEFMESVLEDSHR